jgi:hypothetical protein
MPDEKTRADALRCFLTGASTHEGTQTDPDLSLGLHQSSTEMQSYDWDVTSPISNIDIEFISGANSTGAGTLTATGSDTVKWTPPGGTQGDDVTIANGETKICEGGGSGEENEYIRITRTSAAALSGTATVTISDKLNNTIGFDDVTSAERSAGDDEYRCYCVENMSAADVTVLKVKLATLGTQVTSDAGQLPASGAGTIQTTGSFADWPDEGYAAIYTSVPAERELIYYSSRTATVLTVPAAGRGLLGSSAAAGAASDTVDAIPGIGIALDAPTSQPSGSFEDETGTGEDTSPGFSFTSPIFDADALSIGTLSTNEIYGIWIHREIPAGAVAKTNVMNDIIRTFDAA